jgi:tripartite-type tricarboxylate transporter receptor subunit TctC
MRPNDRPHKPPALLSVLSDSERMPHDPDPCGAMAFGKTFRSRSVCTAQCNVRTFFAHNPRSIESAFEAVTTLCLNHRMPRADDMTYKTSLFVLCFAALFATSQPLAAQSDWPNRPVRVIVPFGAGGSSDTLARIVANHLSTAFNQQFVVENRPGAGGVIGVQAIASAEPDGYTIGMTNLSTLSLAPIINRSVPYDPMKSLTHISYVGGAPVVLSANPNTGVKTLADFIAYAKQRGFVFVSSGVGSDGHLMGQAIALSVGVKIEHVPYKQTQQALSDIVAGHVPFSTFTLSSTSQFLRAGQLNGVALTTAERLPDYASIPTFKELGHPNLVGTTWFSMSGPAKLPKDIVDRINAEITKTVMKPEVQERFRRDGFVAMPASAEEFTKFVAAETAKWRPTIEAAGLVGKGQ